MLWEEKERGSSKELLRDSNHDAVGKMKSDVQCKKIYTNKRELHLKITGKKILC